MDGMIVAKVVELRYTYTIEQIFTDGLIEELRFGDRV
jgi:hypothetical protein